MTSKTPENDAQKEYEEAVLEVLKDAAALGERAGCGPAQVLLAMLLLEISGLRVGLEDTIFVPLRPFEGPPPPEEGEEWKRS